MGEETTTITSPNLSFLEFEDRIMHRKLSAFHREDLKKLNSRFPVFMWPRGHLKTTLITKDYSIYNAWKYSGGFDIAISSGALEQSMKFVEEIQQSIEENPLLHHLIPKKSDTWNKTQMNLANGNRFFVKPFNDTSRGIHVDLMILDDILRNRDITQDEVRYIFWSVFFPTVQTRKGQLVTIGTAMTTDDILHELLNIANSEEGDEKYDIKKACIEAGLLPVVTKRQAVIIDDSGNWKDILWPEKFTFHELKAIKALQGSLYFDREYMNNPKAGGSSIFSEEMLNKKHAMELSAGRDGYMYFLGVDVALSESSSADYSAFIVLEIDANKNLKEVKIERPKRGTDTGSQIKRIKELNRAFNFRKIVIEDMGLSKGMARDMTVDDELKFITEPFITSRPAKELLVSRIETALTSGQLTLLDNPIHLDELRSFGIKKDRSGKETYEALGGHDDTVMALGMALEAALGSLIGTAGLIMPSKEEEDEDKSIQVCPDCVEQLISKGFKKWYCEFCDKEWIL